MSAESKNCKITHGPSDVDFNIYYNFDGTEESVEITGLYVYGHHQDLIDIVSDEVVEDLENDIIYEVEGL